MTTLVTQINTFSIMIKSIRLQNWKSFADATLPVQPLTVLVGTNASGKSNLFEAFSLVRRLMDGLRLQNVFDADHSSFPIRGGAAWIIRHGESQAAITVTLQHPSDSALYLKYELVFSSSGSTTLNLLSEKLSLYDGDNNEKESLFESAGQLTDGKGTKLNTYVNVCMLPMVNQLFREAKGSTSDEPLIDHVVLQLQKITTLSPVPAAMRGYSSIKDSIEVDAANVAGVLVSTKANGNSDIHHKLNKYIRVLPDFDLEEVYAEAIKPLEKDAMLFGVEKVGDVPHKYLVDARTMSDGTLHFIGIVTALLTVPTGSLLIMEEINQGLHPSRAKDLIEIIKEIIKERKIDVMFSTHDPALLDAIGVVFSENIQVVYRNEEGHSNIKCLSDFKMFGKLIGRGSLGKLSTRGELAKAVFQ